MTRLSLLSGGEKALGAISFLFALFLALPIAGEPLTPPVLLGAGMIVGGVALANAGRR